MIDYLEIQDQPHIMRAEGTADIEPIISDIEMAISRRGYGAKDIELEHDNLQMMWRFSANLIAITGDNNA
jgi:hypothetical protein